MLPSALPNIETHPWMLKEGGALDVDLCPDCWERNAHLERYELATRVFPNMHVVDFGCGVGYGSEILSKAGCCVVAVDSSQEALDLASIRRLGCARFVKPGHEALDHPFGGIVAFEVIEHLDSPEWFFEWASKRARHILVSVPVVPTVGINPHHKTDFTESSFKAMVNRHFVVKSEFPQMMPFHREPSILIVHAENRYPEGLFGMSGIKALAFMYAYNEADIIAWSVKHAVDQGLSIHFTDNWSTDGTFEILKSMADSDPRITVSRWPEAGPTERVSWHEMLQRVEVLAMDSGADWCVHYDADEIRRSQVRGERLIDAIARLDKQGFNAIDHEVELFSPKTGYDGSQNPEEYLSQVIPGSHMDKKNGQIKCWKQPPGVRVDLASSGGHRVFFPMQRIANEKLILKHYPLRSPEQEAAKLKSRRERWAASDRAMGFHCQYNHLENK